MTEIVVKIGTWFLDAYIVLFTYVNILSTNKSTCLFIIGALVSFLTIFIYIKLTDFRKNISYVLTASYMILELFPKLEFTWLRLLLWGVIVLFTWLSIFLINKLFLSKNKSQKKLIDICINIIESVIFYVICEILLLAIIVTVFKIKGSINNWIPVLVISFALEIVTYEYWLALTKAKPILIYILFWIIVPIIAFLLYVQNCWAGGYNTFHFLFLIIAAVDSLVLAILSNEMQTLIGKKINDKDNLIATIKIILANITLLSAIATGIFEETRLKHFISWICSKFYWISKNLNLDSYLNIDFKLNGKMTMFISVVLLFIGLLSYLLVYFEKKFSNWGISKLEKHGLITIKGTFYDWFISHHCEDLIQNIKVDKSFPKEAKDWETIETYLKKKKISYKTRKAIRTAFEKYEREQSK